MKRTTQLISFALAMFAAAGMANASKYSDTIALFKNAGESAAFFKNSYAYAVFPNIGEAGFIVGGAFGKGHVYVQGQLTGDATMKQVSVGFQAGGQDYSQIIFFQDKRALEQFESGSFEFSAGAKAVAVTAAATASPPEPAAVSGTRPPTASIMTEWRYSRSPRAA
jgi:lipid-binding SYLF domain-containing protein